MDMKEICPCPNLDCPNHGFCNKCNSRHLRGNFLNCCAFYTILPTLQETIDASPESPTAKKLATLVGDRLQAYEKLREKHGISKESQELLLKKVAEYSDY